MTWQIAAGSTDVTLNVFIKNKTLNDGSGLTGLAFNTGSLTCYYIRPGDNAAVQNLVTQTVTGAHANGGFAEIDAANMPGVYRLDLSDAIIAAGVGTVQIMLRGAANMVDTIIEIQLDLVDKVWDEILTAATHNVSGSAGRRLRQVGGFAIREDTAQGAGTGNNQIQFDSGASAIDGAYDPSVVVLIEGTGTGQSRLILQYDGATKTATVDRNWKMNPDATTVFQILANPGREHVNEGLAQAGGASTITLNALASSVDNTYIGQAVFIRSGTGDDQRRYVTAYNGTTKVATVHKAWGTIPDSTSGYIMLPSASGDYLADVIPEITGISDIPAEPNFPQALMLLYMRERNDFQSTTSERRILNDAGVEVLDAPIFDNGVVFSQGKLTDA